MNLSEMQSGQVILHCGAADLGAIKQSLSYELGLLKISKQGKFFVIDYRMSHAQIKQILDRLKIPFQFQKQERELIAYWLKKRKSIVSHFHETQVFVDNIESRKEQLYWYNKNILINKNSFINKYVN